MAFSEEAIQMNAWSVSWLGTNTPKDEASSAI
jgi:hypothetical protein